MDSRYENVQNFINQMTEENKFSGVVYCKLDDVAGDGLKMATGYSDYSKTEKITLDSQFNIGSIGKTFTGQMIMQLVESGTYDLDTIVNTLLPTSQKGGISQQPKNAERITVKELLDHSAHMGNYKALVADWKKIFPDQGYRNLTFNTVYAISCIMDPLQYTDGQNASYSNSGFIVLGEILAHNYGKSYNEVIQQQIFDKSGYEMSNTTMNKSDAPNRVLGYKNPDFDPNKKNEDPDWNNFETDASDYDRAYSDGGLITTLADMITYSGALFDAQYVSQDYLDTMFQAYTDPHSEGENDYGLAIEVKSTDYGKVIGHGGNTPYFDAAMYRYVDKKATIIILANIGGILSDYSWNIKGKVEELLFA
ncbi:MAG: serine hydrolase domain-containing protein [Bacteroidota bacterium]